MAFNIKAPNVVSTLPTPRIQVPESGRSHAVEFGLAGALSAAKDVAESYRDHQDAVNQAKNLADFYEQNGMQQEADLYRRSADTFRVNFFKDPKAASAARSAILNDALNALKFTQKKKEAEELMSIRRMEAERSGSYGSSMLEYRKGVDARSTASAKALIQQGLNLGLISQDVADTLTSSGATVEEVNAVIKAADTTQDNERLGEDLERKTANDRLKAKLSIEKNERDEIKLVTQGQLSKYEMALLDARAKEINKRIESGALSTSGTSRPPYTIVGENDQSGAWSYSVKFNVNPTPDLIKQANDDIAKMLEEMDKPRKSY